MPPQRPLIVHTGVTGAPWSGRTDALMRRLGSRFRILRDDDPQLANDPGVGGWPGGPIHWYETATATQEEGPGRAGLPRGPIVYDCAQAGLTAQPDPLERTLLARADLVLAANPLLLQTRSAHHGRVILARDGLERHLIGPAPNANLVRPVLGCLETGRTRPDRAVLGAVSRAFPFAQVVVAQDIRWISAFDVCLLAYQDPPGATSLRLAADPVSIPLACLAAGKPTVALDHAEILRDYSPIIEVAKSTARFIEAIAECCLSPCEGLLTLGRQRAQSASWEATAAAIEAGLRGLAPGCTEPAADSRAASVPASAPSEGLRPLRPRGQPACARAPSGDACAGESTWA